MCKSSLERSTNRRSPHSTVFARSSSLFSRSFGSERETNRERQTYAKTELSRHAGNRDEKAEKMLKPEKIDRETDGQSALDNFSEKFCFVEKLNKSCFTKNLKSLVKSQINCFLFPTVFSLFAFIFGLWAKGSSH